jgi:glycosyltransferase involved in cell wall biosynthesis
MRALQRYHAFMRVVHLEAGRQLYGGADQVRSLLRALQGMGVDNVLVCPRESAIASALGGMQVVELPIRGDLDVGLTMRLRSVFRALRPDLVHVHSRRGADWFGGWAAALTGLPAVLTRRVDDREPPWLTRLKCRPYSAVIAISRSIEERLLRRVGVGRERVHHVPSGVDTARYRPRRCRARLLEEFDLPHDSVVVGMSAQLIPRKGHGLLLRSLSDVIRRRPSVRVLCFGRGPLERRLDREVQRLGLGGFVKLAGFRDDLPELLPGLDLLVHPARREGLGVALLEASSSGVPVIATAVGGIVDVVENGVSGLLVPANDRRALGSALARLTGDPSLRERLGAAGRARVEARFSVPKMASGNLAVYRNVLEQRRDGL